MKASSNYTVLMEFDGFAEKKVKDMTFVIKSQQRNMEVGISWFEDVYPVKVLEPCDKLKVS